MASLTGPWGILTNQYFCGGLWSPGITHQPKGAAIVRNLDERSGYGIDYPFVIFTGRKLARFTMESLIVNKDHWIAWRYFLDNLIHKVPRRGASGTTAQGGYDPAKSLSIWHPQLIAHEITQCVVEEEPQLEYDDYMIGHVSIKYCQTKPKPQAGFAKPEAPATAAPLSPDEQEIKRLRDKLASKRQRDEAAGR